MSTPDSLGSERAVRDFPVLPENLAGHPGWQPRSLTASGLAAFVTGLALLLTPITLLGLAGCLVVGGTVAILARRASLDWATVVLLLFISVMAAFGREFAYLHITVGDVPLYVTEVCLATLFAVVAWRALHGDHILGDASRLPLLFIGLYVLVGLARLPHDVGRYGLEAVRDAVLVYYALFALLAMTLLRTWRSLRCALLLVWGGSLIATLLISWNALTGQGVETSTAGVARYGAGIQALSAIFAVLGGLSLLLTGQGRRWHWLLMALLSAQLLVAVLLVQHRSLLLAMAGGLLVLLLVHPRRRRFWSLSLGACVAVSVLILLLIVGLVQAPDAPFLRATMERAATSVDPEADISTSWRMSINLSLLKSVMDDPVLGAGFGEPISFRHGARQYLNVDAHNSFLAILYRLGLPAALCLFVGMLSVIHQSLRAIQHNTDRAGTVLTIYLASFVALVVFACFNVVLEGPYMGIFFWLLLGVLMRFSSPGMAEPHEP